MAAGGVYFIYKNAVRNATYNGKWFVGDNEHYKAEVLHILVNVDQFFII